MMAAISALSTTGMKKSSRRSVMKTARLGRATLIKATHAAMYDNPGGYAPFSAANFKQPKIKTIGGAISANTGYTPAGYIDRFRSTGTGMRTRSNGGSTGSERGLGMVQQAAMVTDPLFSKICEVEMGLELRKEGFGAGA